MLATLTVALIVGMCATPLFLLAREIIALVRHPVGGAGATGAPLAAAPASSVEQIASRPVLPLG